MSNKSTKQAPSVDAIRALMRGETHVEIPKKKTKQQPQALAPTKKSMAEKRSSLDEALREFDTEPIKELLQMYHEKYPENHEKAGQYVMSSGDRRRLMQEILQYQLPKLKSVDMSAAIDLDITVTITEFSEVDAIDV